MNERFSADVVEPAKARPDHGTLIQAAESIPEKVELSARWLMQAFDAYYSESRQIPAAAKTAFEQREPRKSLALSKRRLSIYSESICALADRLAEVFPVVGDSATVWTGIDDAYLPLIEGRYEADLAFAFMHSVRRKVYQGEWKPVEYAFGDSLSSVDSSTEVFSTFSGGAPIGAETVLRIMDVPEFSIPFRDAGSDARAVAERLNADAAHARTQHGGLEAIDVVRAGFFRNRGCYVVGRMVFGDGAVVPMILALLNDENGIFVDAVLTAEADAHNLFSSTLANFNVTNNYYHELAGFLHSIMPKRPLGLHYSTIGFNHVGKVAVMNELKNELAATNGVLETAIGFRGTVAIGFSAPFSAYSLKVIRDTPTRQYKWGEFEGIPAVLRKYGRVHEINRTGSMLDNIIYYNLRLDKEWFDGELLEELLREASQSVSMRDDGVVFKYLIVQRRMTPLPVFLATASAEDAETAVINLGYCIKNNAAANIFNKDLDARNYGVSRFSKVYLFDYDALEPFTEVKIRTNEERIDGEEDIPDWYFEDGVVFLPEEIESGLQIPNRSLRRLFRQVHGDLLTTDYWQRIQDQLRAGHVPSVRIYPESRKLSA